MYRLQGVVEESNVVINYIVNQYIYIKTRCGIDITRISVESNYDYCCKIPLCKKNIYTAVH